MLSPSDIEKLDRSRLHLIYENWPAHCKKAYQIDVNVPEIPDIEEVVYAGMGGSATTGDILQDWLRSSIEIPFHVVKDYHLPKFADKNTFVIATSCSGNTEEVLSIFSEAMKSECKIATISSGGLLEETSLRNNVTHTKIRFTLLSRASFPYLFYVSSKILETCGLIRGLEDQIPRSIEILDRVSKKISVKVPLKENLSKDIAVKIYDSLPVIYGSSLNRAVAIRFKNVLNENSKMHAIVDVIPELCHNEVVAWEGSKNKPLRALLLRYKGEPTEVETMFEIVRELIRDVGFEVFEVWSLGEDRLSKIVSLLYILDFASFYAAALRGFDPTPTVNIDKVKQGLKSKRSLN